MATGVHMTWLPVCGYSSGCSPNRQKGTGHGSWPNRAGSHGLFTWPCWRNTGRTANPPTGQSEPAMATPVGQSEPAMATPTGQSEQAMATPVGQSEPAMATPTEPSEPAMATPTEPSEQQAFRNSVFRDLWQRGYYLTSGLKYGGDFLVYSGDPALTHSSYVAIVLPWKQPCSTLVSLARVAAKVKKNILLCSTEHAGLCYYTVEWAGIT